ncbi:hypothetical protein LINPERPRIM_LOCUS8890 [Linum perenne]
MEVSTECGLCAGGEETTAHLFLDCQISRDCWDKMGLAQAVQATRQEDESTAEWMSRILLSVESNAQMEIFGTMWSLWAERNRRVWEQKSKPEELIVRDGRELMTDWRIAHGIGRIGRASRNRRVCERWHKPGAGRLKINIDGALFGEERKSGVGAVLRDEDGRFRGLMQAVFEGSPPPSEVEARALLMACRWSRSVGLQSVVYETDSQAVCLALNTKTKPTVET